MILIALKKQESILKRNNKLKNMMNAQDLENISQQWQETIKTLIQSFNRILVKYLTCEEKDATIIEKIYEKSFYLFRITNKHIFTEVTIVIRNLLASNILSARKKQTILEEMELWLKRNKNQGQAVHDMMTVLTLVFEDSTFATDKTNFQLILRIYTEILFFSSFSNEYSTYFYNLENMCKAFLRKVFCVVFVEKKDFEDLKQVFISSLPEMFVNKTINKKANETALSTFNIFFDELLANLSALEPAIFKSIMDKLFTITTLKSKATYMELSDSEAACLYIVLYQKILILTTKIIEENQQSLIVCFIDIISSKFLIINELFHIKQTRYKEEVIRLEFLIGKQIIFYALNSIEALVSDPQFEVDKFFACLKLFKFSYAKIEQVFDINLDQIDKDEDNFLTLFYQYYDNITLESKNYNLRIKFLKFLKVSLDGFLEKTKAENHVEKR